MTMNRRNVLLALAVISITGGLVFGTGAFSQVEAQRALSIQTTGDGSAYAELTGDGTYTTTGSNGEVSFDVSRLNDNATTIVNDTLNVSVNPPTAPSNSNTVNATYYVYITSDDAAVSAGGPIDFRDRSDSSVVGAANAVSVSYSSTSGSFGTVHLSAVVNTSASGVTSADSITIHVTDSRP